jgi:hypothetical protein
VVISADLGSSSNYSNELHFLVRDTSVLCQEGIALKAVVEKVSLRLAIMQRLVGPKHQVKTI